MCGNDYRASEATVVPRAVCLPSALFIYIINRACLFRVEQGIFVTLSRVEAPQASNQPRVYIGQINNRYSLA